MPSFGVGDTMETAIWLSGEETIEDRMRFTLDAQDAFTKTVERHGFKLGPISWEEKRPWDDRVPKVPDHIHGPDVRLLVATAEIIADVGIKIEKPGFCHDLEEKDLALLRHITRREYKNNYPGNAELTDRQCDTIINDLGPEAAVKTLSGMKRSDLI